MKSSGLMKMVPIIAFFMLLSIVQNKTKEIEKPTAPPVEVLVETSSPQLKQDACTPIWVEEISFKVTTPDGEPVKGLQLTFNPNTETREGREWLEESEGVTDEEGSCTFTFAEKTMMILPQDRAYITVSNPQNPQESREEEKIEIPYTEHPEISIVWGKELPEATEAAQEAPVDKQ